MFHNAFPVDDRPQSKEQIRALKATKTTTDTFAQPPPKAPKLAAGTSPAQRAPPNNGSTAKPGATLRTAIHCAPPILFMQDWVEGYWLGMAAATTMRSHQWQQRSFLPPKAPMQTSQTVCFASHTDVAPQKTVFLTYVSCAQISSRRPLPPRARPRLPPLQQLQRSLTASCLKCKTT